MPTLCWELRERNEIGKFDRKYLLFPILLVQYGAIQSETCTTKSCIKQDIIPCKKKVPILRAEAKSTKRGPPKPALTRQGKFLSNAPLRSWGAGQRKYNSHFLISRGISPLSTRAARPTVARAEGRSSQILSVSLFIPYLSILFTRLPMFIYLYLCAC